MTNVKLILSSQVHNFFVCSLPWQTISALAMKVVVHFKISRHWLYIVWTLYGYILKYTTPVLKSGSWQKRFLTAAQYKPNTNDRSPRFSHLPSPISKIIRHFHGIALGGIFRGISVYLYPHLLRLYSQHSSFSWNESKWALWFGVFDICFAASGLCTWEIRFG